jgi:hypothetical protein
MRESEIQQRPLAEQILIGKGLVVRVQQRKWTPY